MRVARLSLGPKKYVIIDIDPGIGKNATATTFDSEFPDQIRNTAISQRSSKWYEMALAKLSKARFDHQFLTGQEKADMVTLDQLENHISPVNLVTIPFDSTVP
ncbi:hypothetical protein BGZ47_003566 [Haplosporangium gracile]|nr:hypothetical protein BGZ47_003566 [Haplosporangium gracile]